MGLGTLFSHTSLSEHSNNVVQLQLTMLHIECTMAIFELQNIF